MRLTPADKRHAILLALQTWPEKSAHQIADQIGCNQDYVSGLRRQVTDSLHLPSRGVGRDGKSYPASRPTGALPALVDRRGVTVRPPGRSSQDGRTGRGAGHVAGRRQLDSDSRPGVA